MACLCRHLVDGKITLDGVSRGTDRMACTVRSLLEKMGVRAPDDVQSIGFDGLRKSGSDGLSCSTIIQPIKNAQTCVDIY